MTGVPDGINNDAFSMNRVFAIGELVIKDNNRNEDQYQTDTEEYTKENSTVLAH
ncbi:hypothetical protein APECO18_00595 [Escherichia coli APEC O18]|nr:hypothetical protein APECO18_00595 [Escherichia coli APEC O18]